MGFPMRFFLSLIFFLGTAVNADPSLIHGVFVSERGSPEDSVPEDQIEAYIEAVGQSPAFVYFTNNWFAVPVGDRFPHDPVQRITDRGAVPIVRLMLRSSDDVVSEPSQEKVYTLTAIAEGHFDSDLRLWGQNAAQFPKLYVEFGTEMNGDWFHYNARWNGQADGGDLFQKAYRRVVEQIRLGAGPDAERIGFVFHINAESFPDLPWNAPERYYPGDDVVDLLALSVYGALSSYEAASTNPALFGSTFESGLKTLRQISGDKPIFLIEFGSDIHAGGADIWADAVFQMLLETELGHDLAGFSWWNSSWENWIQDTNGNWSQLRPTDMRVESDAALSDVFKRWLAHPNVVHIWPSEGFP